MKRIAYALLIVLVGITISFASCNMKHSGTSGKDHASMPESTVQTDTGQARILFDVYQHDFGKMVEGEIVSYTFDFTNTGTAPLFIKSASASCGCTVPKYSKKPVKPGKKGELEVVFNSLGKEGVQHKTIAVRANTKPPVTLLVITADVRAKKDDR